MLETQPCILYFDHRSICSSMVRYTFARAGAPLKDSLPLSLELRRIDMFNGGQLSETYLCEVNAKGQVPVLLSPDFLEQPITDSLDITFWLCDKYPDLKPAEHADDITRLLRELHAINFFTLTMRNVPDMADMLIQAIHAKMNTPGISEKHRKALEYKLTVTRSEKVEGVRPEVIKAEIERASALLVEIDSIRKSRNGSDLENAWVFGTAAPTALDTTLICFVARLMDVKLDQIVPTPLLELTQKMRLSEQFKEIWTII